MTAKSGTELLLGEQTVINDKSVSNSGTSASRSREVEILETVEERRLTHLDCSPYIMSDIYSQHLSDRLSNGRQASAGLISGPLFRSRPLNPQLLRKRHYTVSPIVERSRWMRIPGAVDSPLGPTCTQHPFLQGGVRFKSKKKMKKAKAKKREVLSKIKRMRMLTRKKKEDMSIEEKLEFRLSKVRPHNSSNNLKFKLVSLYLYLL
jgi:hypothetical protein